jgi:hypothetical protein
MAFDLAPQHLDGKPGLEDVLGRIAHEETRGRKSGLAIERDLGRRLPLDRREAPAKST